MVIENKGGAGGNIAAQAVLQAEADGYTVYICSIGHAINQFIYPHARLRPGRGLRAGDADVRLSEHSGGAEFLARPFGAGASSRAPRPIPARSPMRRPASAPRCISRANCSSAWPASISRTFPYRGAGPALNDLHPRPGRCDLRELSLDPALCAERTVARARGHHGEAPAGSAATCRRSPSSCPGYDVSSWFALFVAAKTPPDIVSEAASRCGRGAASSAGEAALRAARRDGRRLDAGASLRRT